MHSVKIFKTAGVVLTAAAVSKAVHDAAKQLFIIVPQSIPVQPGSHEHSYNVFLF